MKTKFILVLSISLFACMSLPPAGSDVTITPTEEAVILPTQTQAQPVPTGEVLMKFEFSSSAFANGGPIPAKYSCSGGDFTPALTWTGPPAGT